VISVEPSIEMGYCFPFLSMVISFFSTFTRATGPAIIFSTPWAFDFGLEDAFLADAAKADVPINKSPHTQIAKFLKRIKTLLCK
jgi:hypothetical protein